MIINSFKLFKIALTNNKRDITQNLSISVVLEVMSVAILYFLNQTYGTLYQAIQVYDTYKIWNSIATFTMLAMVLVVVNGYLGYFINKLAFDIRTGLTRYFLQLEEKPLSVNLEQRVQEDFKRFGESACDLWFAILKSALYLPTFLSVIIGLTQWYVAVTIVFAVTAGTVITKLVANKLVKEQAIQENNEAEFRKDLSEANYLTIFDKFQVLNRLFKYLSFTQAGISQIFVLLPFIILMPLYISKAITMGAFFQAVNALGKIIDSLSVLIDSRQIIVQIETCIYRLKFFIIGK